MTPPTRRFSDPSAKRNYLVKISAAIAVPTNRIAAQRAHLLRAALQAGLFGVALATRLCAQPDTILNDTFADGERLAQTLPNSLAWYTTSAASGNLAVRTGALTLVANDNDRPVWGYFPAVVLNVGDALTFTVDFRLSVTPPNLGGPGFEIALCYTNGVAALRRSDGGPPTGGYQGYGTFTNPGAATAGTSIRKRSGPAARNATATLLEVTDGPTDIVWDDNWGGGPVLAAAFAQVGAFALPATSRDAALVANLQPGSYTVQVGGGGNTTGVALVEVYEVP